MEREKTRPNELKGLSLRSAEVQEVMGAFPRGLLRGSLLLLLSVSLLLGVGGYCFRVPSYAELDYVVRGGTQPVALTAAGGGTLLEIRSGAVPVRRGDTLAAVVTREGDTCRYVSPAGGLFEANFLFAPGDVLSRGDTLCRIVPREARAPEVLLRVPAGMAGRVGVGMAVQFPAGEGADVLTGRIGAISRIPDASGCFMARVDFPAGSSAPLLSLPPAGRAKLRTGSTRLISLLMRFGQAGGAP